MSRSVAVFDPALRDRVVKMRLKGASIATLADIHNMSMQDVDRIVGDYILSPESAPEDAAIEQQLRKLEDMDDIAETIQNNDHPLYIMGAQVGNDPMVKLKAIDMRVKIMDRQAKLLGQDRKREEAKDETGRPDMGADRMADAVKAVLAQHGMLQPSEPIEVVPRDRDVTDVEPRSS
jgi:hypothetical protein